MTPAQICQTFLAGPRLEAAVEELSSAQLKAVLREGGIRLKAGGGYVSPKKRRRDALARIIASLQNDDDQVASELLQQWLLHHRRPMLIRFLDLLGASHEAGETDQSFLVQTPADTVRAGASRLFAEFPSHEVQAYLHCIAYQQKAHVFDDWPPLAPPAGITPDALASPPAELNHER